MPPLPLPAFGVHTDDFTSYVLFQRILFCPSSVLITGVDRKMVLQIWRGLLAVTTVLERLFGSLMFVPCIIIRRSRNDQ
jgi:hypothetical protein